MNDAATRSEAAATSTAAGSYRVLARKYRPATFADLIGQDAMVRTISNAFESGRIPQAWILTGVRGVPRRLVVHPVREEDEWRIANIIYGPGEDFVAYHRRLRGQ